MLLFLIIIIFGCIIFIVVFDFCRKFALLVTLPSKTITCSVLTCYLRLKLLNLFFYLLLSENSFLWWLLFREERNVFGSFGVVLMRNGVLTITSREQSKRKQAGNKALTGTLIYSRFKYFSRSCSSNWDFCSWLLPEDEEESCFWILSMLLLILRLSAALVIY